MITPEKYQQTQTLLEVICSTIVGLPLEEVLEWIERAEAMGPLVDPSLWLRAHEGMDDYKRIVKAFLAVKEECLKQLGEQAPKERLVVTPDEAGG